MTFEGIDTTENRAIKIERASEARNDVLDKSRHDVPWVAHVFAVGNRPKLQSPLTSRCRRAGASRLLWRSAPLERWSSNGRGAYRGSRPSD